MSCVRGDIVNRSASVDVRKIDLGIKNPWRWEWLEKEVDGINFSECFRKLNKCGTCYCVVCGKELMYGSKGYLALVRHVKSSAHMSTLKSRKENFALPGSGGSTIESPYGLHPMFAACQPVAEVNLPQASTPLNDRVVNYEAMLLGFLAEKSLPFSLAPDLLHLVKEMAKDGKALNQVTMHRTAASYKMRFGVAKTIKEKLFEDLQREFFSLNVDESTSSNNQRVVTVLVNYLSKERNIVTKHLFSYSIDIVNSETIFQGIVKIFAENNIPWKNLMSILLDSCNVMRGKYAGLEAKIRTQCLHLLDIDGDSCHHVHNAAKQFSKPFEMYVESLCTDIHNDLKWSPDMRAIFSEICSALKVKYTMPQAFISFRWLSVYDTAQDLLRLQGALTVFYYSFLCNMKKSQFLHILISIYKASDVSIADREHIRNLQRTLSNKVLTQAGQDRKDRIVKKLFDCRLETQLVSNLFVSVLSLMKEYVKLFQTGAPLIHILHDKQFSLVKDFLSCFIKSEKLASVKDSSKRLKLFDVVNRDNHLPTKSVFVGENVKKLYASAPKSQIETVEQFKNKVLKAYMACSKKLQQKMPLDNLLLNAVSAIDPSSRQHSLSLKYLKDLPDLATNVLSVEEREAYDLEVHRYHVANLRQPEENEPVDNWWGEIEKSTKFPLLSRMACALLTCFHGPKVESSFSIMNSVITPGSSRLNVQSFDAIQTVKYELNAQKKTAVEFFAKGDFLHDPIDKRLTNNMRSAYSSYKNEMGLKRKECATKLCTSNEKLLSKEAAKKICANATKLQRDAHKKKMHKKKIPSPSNKQSIIENVSKKSGNKRKIIELSPEKNKGPIKEMLVPCPSNKETISEKSVKKQKINEHSISQSKIKEMLVPSASNKETINKNITKKSVKKTNKPLVKHSKNILTIKEMFAKKLL